MYYQTQNRKKEKIGIKIINRNKDIESLKCPPIIHHDAKYHKKHPYNERCHNIKNQVSYSE
jgi:hypothetical protein